MKKSVLLLTSVCLLHASVIAQIIRPAMYRDIYPDFMVKNEFGDTILYNYNSDGSATVSVGQMVDDSTLYVSDSLVIPETVHYNGVEYSVTRCVWNAFRHSPSHVKHIHLPSSLVALDSIYFDDYFDSVDANPNPFYFSNFETIVVDAANPAYKNIGNFLCSKDGKTLIAFPRGCNDSIVEVPEGIITIGPGAFGGAIHIKSIVFPNTLKSIGYRGCYKIGAEEICLKDSITELASHSLPFAKKIILGNQIHKISALWLSGTPGVSIPISSTVNVYCYTTIPPQITEPTDVYFRITNLYIPHSALHLYQQADGWKDCASILPIEPPIVVGQDTASISWVQNFSATGYQWQLYRDEAHSQLLMTLNFNAQGYLTGIVLGNLSQAPQRMLSEVVEEDEDDTQEKHFAEYYSFTVTGLTPNTSYYYVQNALNGSEVISSESGSFTTLSNTSAGIEEVTEEEGAPIKYLKDGRIYIRRNGIIYDASGVRVK